MCSKNMCHNNITCNKVKVMLASAFGLCGNCYFRLLRHIAPAQQRRNAVSLLDFAEIVSSQWVFSHTQIIIFVTLFYFFLDFIFALEI